MGIPDEESWLRTGYLPTGTARGWRRTGCLLMLIGAAALMAIAVVAGLLGTDEDSDDPGASFGSGIRVDLAIYFTPTASDDDITSFMLDVLSVPATPGREGQAHPPGVQYTSGDYTRNAAYVTFTDDATPEEEEALLAAVLADPRVDRIEQDVIPSETP